MLNGINRKFKVLFPVSNSDLWLGGVNYYKNLFQAISMLDDDIFDFYASSDNPAVFFDYVKPYNLHEKDIIYKFNKIFSCILSRKFDKHQYFIERVRDDFDCFSHFNDFVNSIPLIGWIPDFQHKYLPEMFSNDILKKRETLFLNIAKNSKLVILSSNNACSDFENFYPEFKSKARVLHFVSYINSEVYNVDITQNPIKEKYFLPYKYFYLPNQFWKHKNHITVIKAVKLLKDSGINVKVLCSGCTSDYRNKDHFAYLKDYISKNALEDNVKFLGIIGLEEVYYLMRNCVSIINPSLFEGWSTTVEEAKSLGKNIILSDLNVHREQNPPGGIYFEPLNVEQLAGIMKYNWINRKSAPDFELEENAKATMNLRMREFGQTYLKILKEIFV